ncbi:MAG: hypothetical protein JO117_05110 [Verrucomicrobia bacterium]|nr:hypothetical protein [Verrucomicrobiota bacterium]MBV9657687.1 hypothetical protein [Verrucomicrobiota bacterium]
MRSLPRIFLLLALLFAYARFFQSRDATPARPAATVENRSNAQLPPEPIFAGVQY